MPQIREYLPEENASGPQGATSPNLEAVTAMGRGIETLGRDIGEGAAKLAEHHTQLEQADVYANLASQRADRLEKMQQEVEAGTFNIDKFKEEYQDWHQEEYSKLETVGGRAAFTRQSGRLFGSLTLKAFKAQTMVTQNHAKNMFMKTIDTNAGAVYNNPDQFDDLKDGLEEQLHDLKSLGLNEDGISKLREHALSEYSKAAVNGTAVTMNDPHSAKDMLDPNGEDNMGQFMKWEDQRSLSQTVDRLAEYKDTEPERLKIKEEKAERAKAETYIYGNLDNILKGKINAAAILADKKTIPNDKVRYNAFALATSMESRLTKSDPMVLNDTRERLLLDSSDPKSITSLQELISVNGISPQDKTALARQYLGETPATAVKERERLMFNDVKSMLHISGIPDSESQNRVANAMDDFQTAKKNMIDAGDDWHELLDPKSKNYFPLKVRRVSAQDIFKSQLNQFSGAGSEPNPRQFYSPGMDVPKGVPANIEVPKFDDSQEVTPKEDTSWYKTGMTIGEYGAAKNKHETEVTAKEEDRVKGIRAKNDEKLKEWQKKQGNNN